MVKLFSKAFLFLGLIIFIFVPSAQARNVNSITDWYINDFQSEIIVNQDSSLIITEKITADCGELTGKHGIFRVLPTQIQKTNNQVIKTPIELISITDFNNKPLMYETLNSYSDHTVTWKIGDPNTTVKGVNDYKIKYKVQNAIRFDSPNFDEFYWNLNGNFWQLETDQFSGQIRFPEGINQNSSQVDYYTGSFKTKDKTLAQYSWQDNRTLIFTSTQTLKPGEGITVSVTFAKNIFTPYVPGFWEKYGANFSFLLPLLVLIICLLLWSKYGRDPKINPTIAPEFSIPQKLPPMELGAVLTDGTLSSRFISAAIVNLAVKKIIKIEEISKKGFLSNNDYKLILLSNKSTELTTSENILLEKLFGGKSEIKISDLKNKFYQDIPAISKAVVDPLARKKLIQRRNKWFLFSFIIVAMGFLVLSFVLIIFAWQLFLSVFLTAIIIFIFAFLLRQRTKESAELLRQIKGFKLYMETAEKYRQQFNEKENIFERFLPYAIVFGMAKLWAEKMKLIYGEEYFNHYHPYWYTGAAMASFNASTFSSNIENLSSSMASTIASAPSSSGVGGGGFSGGGGGGGGGGGW